MTSMSTRPRAEGHSPSTVTTAAPRWLTATYLIDGAGNLLLGVVLLVLPGWLATGVGVGPGTIRVLGAVFVVNSLVNGHAARSKTRSAMVPSVAIDAVFGIGVLVVAITDPSGAELWARWLLGVTGVLSLDLAAVKAFGTVRFAR